jgi:probable phosphoglycerate mutase
MTPFESVYLTRHGQTQWNVEGRKQGRLDSPLTPHGLDQVRRNAELVSKAAIDAVFASPLGRAHTSAQIFAATLQLPLQVLDDLSEVDHGAWSGLTSAEIEAGWPEQRSARELDKYTYRFPGGESYADADARVGRALAEVARSGSRTPLLVSHEMVGRMLVKRLAGLTPEQALLRDQPSEVVYRVGYGGRIDRLTWAK